MTAPVAYQVGQALKGGVARLRETETVPPKRFTEGTLISAMTHIHRFVSHEADRKVLRDTKGIGTERTRDAIIETLKQRNYIVRGKKGELQPTALGIELIRKLPAELSNPITTAKWEMALGLIEQGHMTRQQFDTMIRGMTLKLVEAMKAVTFELDQLGISAVKAKPKPTIDASIPGHGQTCEQCRQGRMVGKRFPSGKKLVGCSNYPACQHTKWIDDGC